MVTNDEMLAVYWSAFHRLNLIKNLINTRLSPLRWSLDAELPEQDQAVPHRPQLRDLFTLETRKVGHDYGYFLACRRDAEKGSSVLGLMVDAVRGVIALDHQMVYPHTVLAEGIVELPDHLTVSVVTHHISKRPGVGDAVRVRGILKNIWIARVPHLFIFPADDVTHVLVIHGDPPSIRGYTISNARGGYETQGAEP